MRKIKAIFIGCLGAGVVAAVLIAPALAMSGTASTNQCYLVVQNVSTVLNNMHDVGSKREASYSDAATRVGNELRAAQSAGYDTTQLQTDYHMISNDLEQFQTDQQTFEADLTNVLSVSQSDCSSTSGQFVNALTTARNALSPLRADDVKLRIDIREKLVTDIRAYITWLRARAADGKATN